MTYLMFYRDDILLNSYNKESNKKHTVQTEPIELKIVSKSFDKSLFYRPNYFFNL